MDPTDDGNVRRAVLRIIYSGMNRKHLPNRKSLISFDPDYEWIVLEAKLYTAKMLIQRGRNKIAAYHRAKFTYLKRALLAYDRLSRRIRRMINNHLTLDPEEKVVLLTELDEFLPDLEALRREVASFVGEP
jgi:hypothetical protein